MATELLSRRRAAKGAALTVALALALGAGCAPSMRADFARVREASGQRAELPELGEGRVEAEPPADVQALLGEPLDADTAVRIALLGNRELRAQLRELGVARARVLQAGLVANPKLEAELLPERDSDLELRVEYEVSSLLTAPMKRRAEHHALEAARLQVAARVVETGFQVRAAFYALQTAAQRLRYSQQTLDALAAGRDAALALLEAGNLPELDASTHIVGYERARIMVAEQELSLAALRERLQRLLGLHGDSTGWSVEPALPAVPEQPPTLDGLEGRALEANLDLRALGKQLDALARRTGAARTEGWLPEVALDVHSLRTKDEQQPGERQWRWGGGVSVEVPLFDHGQGERRGYEAQFDATLERYHGLAIEVRSRAREASNRLRSAHARARQYQSVILPAQRRVMEQTLLQYNAMQLGVFQLLEARRELLQVELAYADTLGEYWSAEAAHDALLSGRAVQLEASGVDAPRSAAADARGGH